jgi:hypothetical protein
MRLADYEEYCWGLPFDWQSAVLVPARSPLLYDSWQAGEAFAEHFELAGNTGSHEISVSACRGMLTIFNRTVDDSQHLSLSYTPHDHLRVFNVNALGGGLLCKLGSRAGESRLASSGRRMLNWVVAHQSEDGSWSYHSAGNGEHESIIDHYHTAMLLQGLLEGFEAFKEPKWAESLERGICFYLERMFDAEGRPKFRPSQTFPVDVMSCAEGIMLLSRLRSEATFLAASIRADVRRRLHLLATWACRHLQSRGGPFYYRVYPGIRLKLYSHRWAQGPMLKALASFLT